MQDLDGAMQCYEQALKHNQWSIPAMQGIACILRARDQFPHAVEYLRTILKVDPTNGDVWGSLGTLSADLTLHCTSNILQAIVIL
jgi:glucose repression mediator protein